MVSQFIRFDYSSDADVRNWLRRVLREGEYNVSQARITLLETLVGGLKSDGVWSKLDRLWLFAAENQTAGLVDLVGGSLATKNGTLSFATDRGYTGIDGSTTDYLDLLFTPSVHGVNYQNNSAHLSTWVVTNLSATSGGAEVGIRSAGDAAFYITDSTGNVFAYMNDGAGSQGAPGTRVGHWINSRTGSSANTVYQNASTFSSPNASSTGLPTVSMYACAVHFNTVPAHGSPNQVAMVSVGGGLNSTEVSNFYTRLRTFMTAIGVP